MAEIVKFTPKEPRLSVEVLDTMAAAAAERYHNAPWAVRDGQEPRCSIRALEGKVVRPAAAARWVYENITLPKAQHDAFRKMLLDAGINKQEAGDTALDALIERTVITQPALIEAVAARHKAKVFVDPVPEAEDTVVPVDFEAREREAEDAKIGLMKDWLEEYGWCALMVLADERPGPELNDQDRLSYWVQDNWHGSTAFRRAPLEGLRRQAAHDTIYHWMAGVAFDLARLNRIAANARSRR